MAKKLVGHPSLTGKSGETPKIYLRVPKPEQAKWRKRAKALKLSLSAWLRGLANKDCEE